MNFLTTWKYGILYTLENRLQLWQGGMIIAYNKRFKDCFLFLLIDIINLIFNLDGLVNST